jgi:hypothetical protein
LATGVAPVERHAVGRRYAIALTLGTLASGVLMLSLLGVRPDLAAALWTLRFWVKLGFVAGLAAAALLATLRLSRRGAPLAWEPIALTVPILTIWTIAGLVLADADPAARAGLIFGTTWTQCPGLIAMLSLPLFVGVLWAMRGLAGILLGSRLLRW